jgi:hypothetical protein
MRLPLRVKEAMISHKPKEPMIQFRHIETPFLDEFKKEMSNSHTMANGSRFRKGTSKFF